MGTSMTREHVLTDLWREISGVKPDSRILVALDGFDGAGKTHLAGELEAIASQAQGRPFVRASIDGFHRPRTERLAAGTGPDGFYRGSYRYAEFRSCVVESSVRGRAASVPRRGGSSFAGHLDSRQHGSRSATCG